MYLAGLDVSSTCEAGSYLRLIDSCVTQLKAQGPSRTCNESKEEEYLRNFLTLRRLLDVPEIRFERPLDFRAGLALSLLSRFLVSG